MNIVYEYSRDSINLYCLRIELLRDKNYKDLMNVFDMKHCTLKQFRIIYKNLNNLLL